MDTQMRRACEWICSQLKAHTTREDVLRLKREAAVRFKLKRLPKNSEVLEVAGNDRSVVELLQRKPTRTLSGVAVVAIMTSPHPCPHGVCVPCPGGPHTPYASPQSYVGKEPAARRAAQWGFDPYMQTSARLHQLSSIGHGVSKVELIVMGGTFTARPAAYQRWFVMRALQAMNEYPDNVQCQHVCPEGAASPEELAHAQRMNEVASVRCVGLTLETRPDWAREEHIDIALELGATKVELGVQSVFDDVLAAIERGHTVQDVARANQLLRDSGLKLGFHIMPALPCSSFERDIEMFRLLFSDERFMPDYLKIYPTLVIRGTRLYELMEQGEYTPMDTKRAVELLATVKPMLPPWVRVSRIQRDIPCQLVDAGVQKSNLRELVHREMKRRGTRCRCIRCREVGRGEGAEPRLMCESYGACGGTEHFISMEDPKRDVLFGFIRLRYPNEPHRAELFECALIRELHVYGKMVDIGERPSGTKWQHRGLGELLLRAAERRAAEDGFSSIAVLSGVGAREYYLQRGYERKGPYMVKQIGHEE
ncbi:MAG TPA: tRNA uridine(34) 5-carboxymethylaminomethyl modification radical SAM/GNAT enzyme Elp3 [Methermicoccus shengliensis]|uniref:tRNA carboxymethyluridine synthase n=2 Tax=Methermicoccus shengliensis TaxID=660064 RepID=A0A832RW64_9EURY|nr:tRNA uridine(34) 5-carboxymethylaminomethyl modification radical SAM/GNAT enzyme Elp3 [Methermicoccus shengliensis]